MRFWRNLPPFARRRPYGSLGVAAAIVTVLALVAILLSSTTGIFASPRSTSTRGLDTHRSHQVRLHGVKPRALNDLKATGNEDGSHLLHLSIALRLAQPIALNGLIAEQQAHGSAKYHQYLTPQSFTDHYGPSADNVAAVRNFLQQSGLKVTSIASNRLFVNAEGTVTQVEKTFGVSIVQYQLGKRLVFAPEQDPIIPDSLAATVLSIGGLDDVAAAHAYFTMKGNNAKSATTSATTGTASPRVTNPSPVGGFTPTNLHTAYDVSTLITKGGTGASQRVAVFELAPYIPGDITTYRTQYGLPSSPINNISVDGATVTCTSGANCDTYGVIESDLDIEVLSALAPNATLDVYVGPNTDPYTSYINDTYNAIVTRNVDKVVTTSWGLCEPNSGTSELQALDNIFAEAAAQGQTIFAASGDGGSDDCRSNPQTSPSVDSPASDPYVMGVGGTALTLSATGGYGSESVWNSHDGVDAGGGGLSGYFSKPTWQVGGGVTNSYASGQREVPDVAAEAEINTGYSIYCTSLRQCALQDVPYGWVTVGGTGGAAPLWAAITADINSYLTGHGFAPFGWANPTFYTLFTGLQVDPPFRDVTVGNNDSDYGSTAYAGDYPATTCFDLATGMGSPDAWIIANDMAGQLRNGNDGPCYAPEAQLQLISDSSFEAYNRTPWFEFSASGHPVRDVTGDPHSGARSAIACGYPGCDDRVWQTVQLPSIVATARLTFWEDANTDLTRLGTGNRQQCLDHFYVTLATADGTVIDTVVSSCATNTNGYMYRTFDVTNALKPYQGQAILVMFRGTTSNISVLPWDSSIWSVDDVSLSVG